jgi:hypothetical protein
MYQCSAIRRGRLISLINRPPFCLLFVLCMIKYQLDLITGVPWTEEETAVLLIFLMWDYRYEVIADILTNRRAEIRGILYINILLLYKRTVSAVRNKLNELRD